MMPINLLLCLRILITMIGIVLYLIKIIKWGSYIDFVSFHINFTIILKSLQPIHIFCWFHLYQISSIRLQQGLIYCFILIPLILFPFKQAIIYIMIMYYLVSFRITISLSQSIILVVCYLIHIFHYLSLDYLYLFAFMNTQSHIFLQHALYSQVLELISFNVPTTNVFNFYISLSSLIVF